jgi:D-aspartate ligase
MVEPTVGRTDYQEEIATLNGVNIPLAAYWGALGRQYLSSIPPYPPRAWRDSVCYAKARLAGAPDHLQVILPEAKITDALFRANDPMPFMATKFESASHRLRSLLGQS